MIIEASNLLNKIMAFFTGLFLSAIFFFLILKLIGTWGILLALIIGYAVNFLLFKKYRKTGSNWCFLNYGLFSFNIITSIAGIVAYVVFYSAMQNLLN